MNYRKIALTAAAGLWLCVPLRAQDAGKNSAGGQGDPGYAAYLAARKARLEQNLSRRVGAINQRFDEEMAFRRKLKDERISFEKKMEKRESDFLDSLNGKDPQSRMAAWSSYYAKTGQERETFYASLRQESREFWEARLGMAAASLDKKSSPAVK
ncbi:MAG: hypothetical protein KGL04_07960 [Elusimicrobia bacterium]|nr:hypothetical protein [Elusimicrobiota bacterium]MDE2314094.1 hypothetical protein [Elusimicrobiota bacterium]